MTNLLNDTQGKLTFNQYTVSDFWTGSVDAEGYPILSASVETLEDTPYELEFSVAANLAANAVNVDIEITFAGEVIGSISHSGAVFADQSVSFIGTGGTETLQFRVMDNTGGSGDQNVDTTGVIPSYEKTMTFMGEEITVDAFMPGQGLVYQVLGGKLVKFDLTTNTYADLEYQNTFKINSIGFSTTHDLIFGQARANGTDANGNSVVDGDIIAFDARGKVYKVAETPYKTYIGDIDANGDLWIFDGSINGAHKLDFDTLDENNKPATTYYDLPSVSRSTKGLADMAFNPETETFYGVAHGNGAPTLFGIDISGLPKGEPITVTETVISGTIVDGVTKAGIPTSAYGATMVDGDGNVYASANSADHDLDANTGKSGGFYKLVTGQDGNTYMELLADAPNVSNNDGAMDTRGLDPFLGIDTSSKVLLKEPVLSIALAEDDAVQLTAKGSSKTINLLANDTVSDGETLTITHIDGQAAVVGMQLTLSNGEIATYNGNGSLTLSPTAALSSVQSTLTYSIVNENGVTDTATVTVSTSPVDGTAGDDSMLFDYTDADGNQIQQADGASEVVMGYGGNDKIFAGSGNDDIYGGSGNDFIRAHEGDDLINGGEGNDVLDGGAGTDIMIGGNGNDIYYVHEATDTVSENGTTGTDKVISSIDFILADNFENLTLAKGSAALNGTGNSLRNVVVGNDNDNLLKGEGGNDYILAGLGNDTIEGGDGDDNVQGGQGNDVMYGGAGRDQMHGQEGNDLQFGGDGDDTLCPNVGDDTMYGGDGNDLLSGLEGVDIAYGGKGNDTYKIQDIFDTVIEYADEGIDVVHSHVSFVLSDHVENLRLTGSGDNDGTGNDLNNRIIGNNGTNTLTGNDGRDHLAGKDGADVLNGGDGNDRLFGQSGHDTLNGGADKDFLAGGSGNDTLDGDTGNDTLKGGKGDDELRGGAGDDILKGNAGADVFVFAAGDGNDKLRGWTAEDTLRFEGLTAEDLTITQEGSKTFIDYGAGDTLMLANVQMSDLTADSFDFI